jgi:hypothetical protein
MHETLKHHFDEMIRIYSQEKFLAVLMEAKKTYFNLTGVALEEDGDYEERMSSFNFWYLTDFRHPTWPTPPLEMYLEDVELDDDLKTALRSVRHSLYEYTGRNMRRQHVLYDILYDIKVPLSKDYDHPTIVKNDVFLGRTVTYEGQSFLLPGICFMPGEVKSILKRQSKKVRKSELPGQEAEFLRQVEYLKTKWRRYGHLDATRIFDFTTFGAKAP